MTAQEESCGQAAIGVFALAALLFAPIAEATHEVDHRYLVLEYVRDSAGWPIRGAQAQVVRRKTGFSYRAETDADGFYLVVVHLHDEDLSDALEVTTGQANIRIRAQFNPQDAKTHRGTRIDIRGGRAEEGQEMFAETLRDCLKR